MQQIKNIIKNSTLLSLLYVFSFKVLLFFLQLFVKVEPKQILFAAYSGRQISDTPLAAFEILKADPDFADYKFIWAVNDVQQFEGVVDVKLVAMDSLTYFYYLVQSKYWISNASIERLIVFKHPKNIYIQFWHGIPLKTLGHAEKNLPSVVQNWYDNVQLDYLFAYGTYDAEKLKTLFPKTKQVVEHGQLRKWLSDQASQTVNKQLNAELKSNKPVLLYAPTYRTNDDGMPFLNEAQLKDLMTDYQVIYRGHYFSEHLILPGLIDGNAYDIYQLFAVSDLLITDYSSVLFDFAYWHKPIYLYTPDLKSYQESRGFYFDPVELGLPVATDFKQLQGDLQNGQKVVPVVNQIERHFDQHPTPETVAALKNIFQQ